MIFLIFLLNGMEWLFLEWVGSPGSKVSVLVLVLCPGENQFLERRERNHLGIYHDHINE